MSARCVAVVAAVALAPVPALAGPRVGFAVLPGPGTEVRQTAAATESIASLRADLAGRGVALLPAGDMRGALEGPLRSREEAEALARARRRVESAREAYAAFDYDRALARLIGVDRDLVDREPAPDAVDLMIERHLLAGLIQEGSRRRDEARRSFRLVHHLDPDRHALDPGEYRPQVVALFTDVVRSVEPSAALRVVTDPPGARVWLDGVPAGDAPLALDRVPAGDHWVVAAAPGRRPRGAMVEIDPRGPLARVSLGLAPQSSTEKVRDLRRGLTRPRSDRAQRRAIDDLARAAGVDVLVLVRARDRVVEGAAYTRRSGELSAWLPLPSDRLIDRIAQADEAPVLVGGGAPASHEGEDHSRSWYSTWWGRTLLITGGLAVGGAVLYGVTAGGGDEDPGYTIGVCFEGKDCP